MWHLYYDIHGLVSVEIIGSSKFDRGKNLRFFFFEVDKVDDPDIVLRIGKFKPSNQGCQIVSHKYHIKENYFYCRDSDRGVRWEIEIFGFEEGKTEVNFNAKGVNYRSILLSNYWAQDVVRPMIDFKLLQKNHFSIHGGAIDKDSKTYTFTGRGGAFKTTLIMDLVRKADCGFLGDERVIIGEEEILCFPMSLFLFDYALKHSATENLGFVNKLHLFRQMLFKGKGYETPIVKSSKPATLFFIEKKDRVGVRRIELSLQQAITKLVMGAKLELAIPSPILPSSHFFDYMMAYSFVFPWSGVAGYWEKLRNGLESALKDVPIYLLEIPVQYDVNVFEKVRSFMMRGG